MNGIDFPTESVLLGSKPRGDFATTTEMNSDTYETFLTYI